VVKNLETARESDTTASLDGGFRLLGLAPGRYELRFERPGFAPLTRLPEIANRDFTNLALLAPGILTDQVAVGSSTGIATAGQTGRDTNFLLDGLTLNDARLSNARGGRLA
jgi:hypothetical protein